MREYLKTLYKRYITISDNVDTADAAERIKSTGTYLVCLLYVPSEEKLYRIPLDTEKFDGDDLYPFQFQGVDFAKITSQGDASDIVYRLFSVGSGDNPFIANLDKLDVLAENVLAFNVNLQYDPDNSDPTTLTNPQGYAKSELPIAIRISLDIYDPNSIHGINPTNAQKEQSSRSFSKVIFLR